MYLAKVAAVAAPLFEELRDEQGALYRVTYQGRVREHRQRWQAWVYYQLAMSLYSAGASTSGS